MTATPVSPAGIEASVLMWVTMLEMKNQHIIDDMRKIKAAQEKKSTRKTGMNVEKFGINVGIYGIKTTHFFEAFYHYSRNF